MSAIILDGKKLADEMLNDFQSRETKKKDLVIISIGDDPASAVYVRNKIRACNKCGIIALHINLPDSVSESKVIDLIDEFNDDPFTGGIILQLPIPKHFDAQYLINRISTNKDVDGLSFASQSSLYTGSPGFRPCTAEGVIKLIEHYDIETKGKHVVIVGRSDLVGRPLSVWLSNKTRNATVTLCNSYTTNLKDICKQADILISAAGFPKLISADMVKKGATVIDVGINRDEKGKLCGDVDFENVKEVASAITPVPGGVGPLTVAMLIDHLPQNIKW